MKFKSEIVTQASGSVGGVTYSRNRGGLYRRARAIPTNPDTTNQQQVRNAFTALIGTWNNLSQAQRDAWDLYGQNTPKTDVLGSEIQLSGQNEFVAANTPRIQAQLRVATAVEVPFVASGPTIFNRGDFTNPTFTMSVATGLDVAFTNTDDWANEDEAALLIYQGRPVNAGRTFFKGPYRMVGIVLGNSTTAPTSPVNISAATLASLGYTPTAGQNANIAVAVTRADGRYSGRRFIGPELTSA